jgi:hypothetical protein
MNRLPNNRARLLALLMIFGPGRALAESERDTLVATPPLGWNSWSRFAGSVSEDLIKSVTDAMASNGADEAGYKYVLSMIAGRSAGTKALSFRFRALRHGRLAFGCDGEKYTVEFALR